MIELDSPATQAGAMERVFLAETAAPSAAIYDADESLLAMRYMRQVIENRLRLGHRYGAPKGATTETDVISVGSEFEGFGSYPKLRPGIATNIRESLRIANAAHDARSADYATFIAHAILAATEAAPPPSVHMPANVVAWKTKDAASPGPNYKWIGSAQGNDFYAVTISPAAPAGGHHR